MISRLAIAFPRTLAGIAVLAAVTAFDGTPAPAGGEGLTVAAAASLGPMFRELGGLFEARSGELVTLVLGSSGNLARQIDNGAPFDLFASADEFWLDRVVEKGRIDPARTMTYALGRLVLLLGADLPAFVAPGPLGAEGLARLAEPDIRYFAMANPLHAPYGRAAQEALERAGLWQALLPKRVYAENIRQALQFVQSGNAEAGLVALSLVDAPSGRWRLVDAALHAPLRQSMGVIRASPRGEVAARFMALVRTAEGTTVLRRFGYQPVVGRKREAGR